MLTKIHKIRDTLWRFRVSFVTEELSDRTHCFGQLGWGWILMMRWLQFGFLLKESLSCCVNVDGLPWRPFC